MCVKSKERRAYILTKQKNGGETGWLVLVVWKGDTISLYTPKTTHCGETGWLVLVLYKGDTISLSTPKTKKHCGETAWSYNFLVYSQDKTLRRERLWRDRLVVQFPCLLPRQNIAVRNIVAKPAGSFLSCTKGMQFHFLVYSQNNTLWRETLPRDRLVGSCRVERGYHFLVYSQNKTLWRNIVARPAGWSLRRVERGYHFLVYSQNKTLW